MAIGTPNRIPEGLRPIAFLRQSAVERGVAAALDEPLGMALLANPRNVVHSVRQLFREIVAVRPEALLGELIDSQANGRGDVEQACSRFGDWSQLARSCQAYFESLSRWLYYTHPEAQRATPPPALRAEVGDWARAHAVEPLPNEPFYALADFGPPQILSSLITNTHKGRLLTVADLAWPSPGGPARDPRLAQVTRTWLWSQAILARRVAEQWRLRVLAWAQPPRHLALTDLAARVAMRGQEVLAQLAQSPQPTWRSDEGALHIAELTAYWRFSHRETEVLIQLDAPPGVPLPVHCGCGAPEFCLHRLSALEALLDLLHSDSVEAAALARELTTPAWAKTLRDLDQALVQRARSPGIGAEESRLAFKIAVGAGVAWVEPVLQRALKRGGWSSGQRLGYRGSLDSFAIPHKSAVLALLQRRVGSGAFQLDGAASFDALELLSGYPHLYLAEDLLAPVTVRRGAAALAVHRESDGTFRIAPTVDGDLALGAQLLERAGSGRHQAIADTAKHACLLVELSSEMEAVIAALARRKAAFPAEAMGELMRRLEPLEKVSPVALAPELEGDAVEADRALIARLSPTADGKLVFEALVRPLPEGAAVQPAEGPARLSGFRGGRRVHVERDFDAELARARALFAGLPLPSPSSEKTWRCELSGDAALDLLAAIERAAGPELVVEWPRDAEKIRVTRTAGPESLKVAVENRQDWFGLSGEVEIDGERLTLALLFDAARRGRRYVQVGPGRFVALSEELRARAARAADVVHTGRAGIEASLAAAPALDDLLDAAGELKLCDEWRTRVSRMRAACAFEPELPAGLKVELRPYQVDGYRWLARLAEWGAGACLADDMGLGKTLQALALLLARAPRGPALVVAPTSVCFNWLREGERFAPSLRLLPFREGDRAGTLAALGPGDVLVCSWGLLVLHAEQLAKVPLATLVLDEAQAIKNPATRRARAARDLSAECRVALSGTPLENHLGELWSLFRVIAPGLLGSWETFRERFAAPIERDRDPERLAALSRIVRPFILRRVKSQVATELPARTEVRQLVTLSLAERRLYDDARIAAVARLAEETANPQQKRFEVLAALTRLRQLACHPKLFDPESALASSKLARFLEIVDELKDNGHRALVFSQFTGHLALVREKLDERGVRFLYLDGQTPEAERIRSVDAFQAGEADVFLISLKAGGTGLNLTAADYVVHLDPWWNPAVEDQATDRAHRLGQTKPVTVYRLVSKGTIEEAILALHEEKRDLVAGVLDGAGTAAKLTNDELMALIRAGEGAPEVDRGEEVEASDVEPPPALSLAAAQAAGAAAAKPLGSIVDAFRTWLQEINLGSSIVTAYPRAVERFLGYARERLGDEVESAGLFQILALAEPYREALQSGLFPAPASESKVARSALRKLQEFAERRGGEVGGG